MFAPSEKKTSVTGVLFLKLRLCAKIVCTSRSRKAHLSVRTPSVRAQWHAHTHALSTQPPPPPLCITPKTSHFAPRQLSFFFFFFPVSVWTRYKRTAHPKAMRPKTRHRLYSLVLSICRRFFFLRKVSFFCFFFFLPFRLISGAEESEMKTFRCSFSETLGASHLCMFLPCASGVAFSFLFFCHVLFLLPVNSVASRRAKKLRAFSEAAATSALIANVTKSHSRPSSRGKKGFAQRSPFPACIPKSSPAAFQPSPVS